MAYCLLVAVIVAYCVLMPDSLTSNWWVVGGCALFWLLGYVAGRQE